MVGSGVAVKKLWKSLRTSVTSKGKGMKRKLASMNVLNKKKRTYRNGHIHSVPSSKRQNGRFGHYNYSDDDEEDGRFRKKLRNWNIKTMSCFLGSVDIKPANDQFVYVTDLYASRSQIFNSSEEADAKADKMKGERDVIASGSGSSSADGNENEKSRSSAMKEFNMKAFLSAAATMEASPSTDTDTDTKRKKTVCWNTTSQAELNGEKDKRISGFSETAKVDTEAEVFIARFYEDMKLQKQKSIVEYREMLERGAS